MSAQKTQNKTIVGARNLKHRLITRNVRSKIRNQNPKQRMLRYSAKFDLISKIKCFQTNSARLDNDQTQFNRLHIHSQATNKQITLKTMLVGSLKGRDPVFASNKT